MGLSISISSEKPTAPVSVKGYEVEGDDDSITNLYHTHDDMATKTCKDSTTFDGKMHANPDDTAKEIIVRAGFLVDGPNRSKNTEMRILFPDEFSSTPANTPYTVFMQCKNTLGVSVQYGRARRLDHICDANVVTGVKQAV
jgi:hypothetical protein